MGRRIGDVGTGAEDGDGRASIQGATDDAGVDAEGEIADDREADGRKVAPERASRSPARRKLHDERRRK